MNVTGRKIREIRISKELTQEELAARIQLTGLTITRSTLAKIEANRRQVTDREVKLIATALKVPTGTLFDE
ncbi:helix-turn-helix domain-containing protein [Shewanella sp. A3A]|nr:helix-turn-helix domain-containing protein [Shewanella ferrihydritica]